MRIQAIIPDGNPVSYTHLDVYKRQDIDRLARIVNNPKYPVQFIFAGKALSLIHI